jgi:LmbE family N-acetylglucosaminyl deacetylase
LRVEQSRNVDEEARLRIADLRSQQTKAERATLAYQTQLTVLESRRVELEKLKAVYRELEAARALQDTYKDELAYLEQKLKYLDKYESDTSVERTGRPFLRAYARMVREGYPFEIADRRVDATRFRGLLDSVRNPDGSFFLKWDDQEAPGRSWPEWARDELDTWGWRPFDPELKEGYE